ncbi:MULTISPECIES: YiaA/YiaB family inner membrane protein [unclassified Streptomyces]|uniref:YiaA/YiaB family inner membrane protein n=1 Tax=unclassified Streptomyces TaxID=2593676 RepID=UPI0022B60DB0|nr:MULTISPECIES: YiaA/YiaB family inner membrane protein [unclassified Streptomyces]MCZ7415634.1 YiaA/YiaB family inner membrane protein [Streptomyces sp. WMMC897]MCZ7434554.1 YiaA/YiaB family inner membrane protein [Streptomyces sp. WMMC1477]
MTTPVQRPTTAAFYVQSIVAFGLALAAVAIGVAYLPLGPWERAFLALGLLFLVSSTFTLAKCVRDRQEMQSVTSRVDQARMEKLISEHDPFEVKNF